MMPSGPAPTGRGESETITYRSGMLQAVLPVLPVLLGFLGGTALLCAGLALTADPMGRDTLRQCLSGAFTATVVVAVLRRGDDVTLTEDALVVRGTRRRRIPWPGIRRLEVRRILGVRRITVHTTDGRRVTLHTPTSFVDEGFDLKVEILTQWWQARRRSAHPSRAPVSRTRLAPTPHAYSANTSSTARRPTSASTCPLSR
ncbi:hypothetical protein OG250_29745 [Streptomyces sp. NBC_00487]|uniref:hypothetical protein n=1 Tax=unclassified Streptomyces TaxID=2593676 RepID=UPI002E16CFBD|nr:MULTISPECIES: hypothetical protein [unclassified Streptomyces]